MLMKEIKKKIKLKKDLKNKQNQPVTNSIKVNRKK
jgi:hypothetical protein